MFDKLKKWLDDRNAKAHENHVKRLATLIKCANSKGITTPNELAQFLIENGVCDAVEVRYIERNAFDDGEMWH